MQSTFARGRSKFTNNIALRTHLRGIPLCEPGIVHRKSVAMLRNRHDVTRPGARKQIDPCIRIEVLGTKLRDEVLVSKAGLRAIGLDMVFELRTALDVHVARVPLVPERRNGI